MKDYYKILGVEDEASEEEIRARWIELTKYYHPDLGRTEEGDEKIREINEAYEILKNEQTRFQYDFERDLKRSVIKRAQRRQERKTNIHKIVVPSGLLALFLIVGFIFFRSGRVATPPKSEALHEIDKISEEKTASQISPVKINSGAKEEGKAPKEISRGVPREAPKEVSREMARKVPKEVPRETARVIAKEVPKEIPKQVPKQAVKEVPKEVPKEIPKQVPREVSKEVSKEVPKQIAKEVPKEVPKETARVIAKEVPKEVPREIPKQVAKEVPEEAPKEVSREIAREVPKEIPKEVAKQVAKEVSEEVPKEAPRVMAKEVPKEVPKEIPKQVAKEVPREVPKEVPRVMAKEVPKEVPKEIPKQVAKEVPKEAPEEDPKEVASVTLHPGKKLTIGTREDKTLPSRPPLLAKEKEVEQFFSNYVDRYNRKDVGGFLAFFSSKAVQNQRDGLEAIGNLYTEFIDQSEEVRYQIEGMKIEIFQNRVDVKARFRVDQKLKKGGEEKVWKGNIRWVLVKEEGRLKISSLDYQNEKSP